MVCLVVLRNNRAYAAAATPDMRSHLAEQYREYLSRSVRIRLFLRDEDSDTASISSLTWMDSASLLSRSPRTNDLASCTCSIPYPVSKM